MRLRYLFTLLCLLSLIFASCEEVGPDIQLIDPEVNEELIDTSYTVSSLPIVQEKKVLIEDFTGVGCVNCPRAHSIIEDLKIAYPGQIIPIAIHSNLLADPIGEDQDLRTEEAQSLEERLGPALGKPQGAINRFELGGNLLLFSSAWAQACANEVSKSVPVNIEIINKFEATEKVLVKVKMVFLENIEEALSVSVFLLESDIEVTQLTPDGEDEAYIHDHVLRKTLTPFSGLSLSSESFESGVVIEKEFELENFEPNWNPENFEVVAFVHQSSGDLSVYQSAVLEL